MIITPEDLAEMLGISRKTTEKYRLLCHNCNSAIGWYGYCPHQKEAACG